MKHRLALVSSHPVQYHAPLFRRIAEHPALDLTVYYCSAPAGPDRVDPGFGIPVQWDVPLLDGYRFEVLGDELPRTPLALLKLTAAIRSELLAGTFDSVIVQGYRQPANWAGLSAAITSDTPIVLRGVTDPFAPRNLWKRVAKRTVLPKLFKRIASFIVESSAQADQYLRYGVPAEKLFIAAPAVDNEYFQAQARELHSRRAALRSELGLPQARVVVVFLNKLISRKRPFDLLKAWARRAECASACLVFVGEGEDRPALEEEARRLDMEHVYFTGFKNQSEVVKYYAVADVFALPSWSDPSPKSLSEALNFGLPLVVSSAVGVVGHLARDGENALIYPVGDVDALAHALAVVVTDESARRSMGMRSLSIADENSYERCIDAFIQAAEYARRH